MNNSKALFIYLRKIGEHIYNLYSCEEKRFYKLKNRVNTKKKNFRVQVKFEEITYFNILMTYNYI